jgi:hypothetical protein
MTVDMLRMQFYSSRHPIGSSVKRNQLDLGNVGLELGRQFQSVWSAVTQIN